LSKVDFHWRSAFPSGMIEFTVAIHNNNRGKVAETRRRFLSWDTIAKLDELRVFLALRIRYLVHIYNKEIAPQEADGRRSSRSHYHQCSTTIEGKASTSFLINHFVLRWALTWSKTKISTKIFSLKICM
jgi:hypothetical protein